MRTLASFTRTLEQLLRDGDVALPALDIDELAALLPPDVPCMPPVRTVGDERAAARGRRRLEQRGLLDDAGRCDSDLELLLTMRRAPGAVVVAEQVRFGEHRVTCHLGFPGVGFLEESVTDDGPRLFTLRRARSTLDRLVATCNPSGLHGAGGAVGVSRLDERAPWRPLNDEACVTRLQATRWAGGSIAEVSLTIVAASDGIWACSDAHDREVLTLPVSRAGLHEVLRRLIRPTNDGAPV